MTALALTVDEITTDKVMITGRGLSEILSRGSTNFAMRDKIAETNQLNIIKAIEIYIRRLKKLSDQIKKCNLQKDFLAAIKFIQDLAKL